MIQYFVCYHYKYDTTKKTMHSDANKGDSIYFSLSSYLTTNYKTPLGCGEIGDNQGNGTGIQIGTRDEYY